MQLAETRNYATAHPLPDPYQREVLDIVGEEAVEVAEAAFASLAVWPSPRAERSIRDLAGEIGDLWCAASLAGPSGALGAQGAAELRDPIAEPTESERREFEIALRPGHAEAELLRMLVRAALHLAKRCSKAKRFGCEEVEPGQNMANGARVATAAQNVFSIARDMVHRGCLQAQDVSDGADRKARQLARFMQHDEGGNRRAAG